MHHDNQRLSFQVLILSLIVAAVAEAPYHLPRPASHAPTFNYPAPAPPPPSPPAAVLSHLNPLPQLPNLQLLQSFNPQLAPQTNFIQPGYSYAQPSPQIQFQPHIHSHPQAVPSLPQISYYAPPQPQPLPLSYPRLQQIYQQPSLSYGQPQVQLPSIIISHPHVEPVRPLPAISLPQRPSPIAFFQQQQLSSGQGYSYQQPQVAPVPLVSQLPLQSQYLRSPSLPSSSVSSYQADTNQYNTPEQSQTHREALDSIVVNRVQNIIKENEHTSARDKGYLSLVSGVSLENAKPSVEISSFVHNSALPTNLDNLPSFSSSSTSQSSSAITSSSSGSYNLPSINSSSQSISSDASLSFLPQTQPATSYGPPN